MPGRMAKHSDCPVGEYNSYDNDGPHENASSIRPQVIRVIAQKAALVSMGFVTFRQFLCPSELRLFESPLI